MAKSGTLVEIMKGFSEFANKLVLKNPDINLLRTNQEGYPPLAEGLQKALPGRPGISLRASHRSGREPLDSSGSCHPKKAAAFHQDKEFLRFPVDSTPTWMACPFAPRELPRFFAITKQCAPDRCIGTFGLVGSPLVPFPFASPTRFSSSARKPR